MKKQTILGMALVALTVVSCAGNEKKEVDQKVVEEVQTKVIETKPEVIEKETGDAVVVKKVVKKTTTKTGPVIKKEDLKPVEIKNDTKITTRPKKIPTTITPEVVKDTVKAYTGGGRKG